MRRMRSWGVVLAFVVIDAVVLGLTWQRMYRTSVDDGVVSASTSATSSATASAGSSASASTSDEVRGPLFLAASDSGSVLRVTRGSCDSRDTDPAQVRVAPTTGATLASSKVPGLQEALGVFVSDNALRIVGADASCKLHGWVSTDAGTSWKRGAVPSRVWYLDTDTTAAVVHGPVAGGVQNLDCTPVSVATVDQGARALVSCSGSNVLVVPVDPTEATVSYTVNSPAAAAQPATGEPMVLASSDTCTSALQRVTSQRSASRVACLGQDEAPLGLAVNGRRVLAQVGQKLMLSIDLGAHFGIYPAS